MKRFGTGQVPCPSCGHGISCVINSRGRVMGTVYRRRQCQGCGARFSTQESVVGQKAVLAPAHVIERILETARRELVALFGSPDDGPTATAVSSMTQASGRMLDGGAMQPWTIPLAADAIARSADDNTDGPRAPKSSL